MASPDLVWGAQSGAKEPLWAHGAEAQILLVGRHHGVFGEAGNWGYQEKWKADNIMEDSCPAKLPIFRQQTQSFNTTYLVEPLFPDHLFLDQRAPNFDHETPQFERDMATQPAAYSATAGCDLRPLDVHLRWLGWTWYIAGAGDEHQEFGPQLKL